MMSRIDSSSKEQLGAETLPPGGQEGHGCWRARQQLPGERGHAGSGSVVFVWHIMLTSVKSGVLLIGGLLELAVPQQHLVSDDLLHVIKTQETLFFFKNNDNKSISNRKHDESNYFLLDDVIKNKGFPIFTSCFQTFSSRFHPITGVS